MYFVLHFAEDDQLMFLVMIKGCVSVGKICDCEIFRVTETTFINLRGHSPEDEKIAEVRDIWNKKLYLFQSISICFKYAMLAFFNCACRLKRFLTLEPFTFRGEVQLVKWI